MQRCAAATRLLDAAITNAFATNIIRPMEFGGDMGSVAVTKAIAERCHSM